MDQQRKKELMEEAYTRSNQYLARWRACAPGTFAAVMDTLGYEGDPVMQEAWKATIGLTGGTGNMTTGTCGAVAGAAAAISLSFGFDKNDLEDPMKMLTLNGQVAAFGAEVKGLYDGIQCQEIQFSIWGKAYKLTNMEALLEFRQISSGDPGCLQVVGEISKLAVGRIIDVNPGFVKR